MEGGAIAGQSYFQDGKYRDARSIGIARAQVERPRLSALTDGRQHQRSRLGLLCSVSLRAKTSPTLPIPIYEVLGKTERIGFIEGGKQVEVPG